MPFRSSAQRRYLFSQHPEVAKEFAAATPKGAKLPEHVGAKPKRRKKMRKKAQELGPKVAAQLQARQLVPGAPPVMRLPQPAGAQQPPQAQQPPPQPPQAPMPGKGAQQVLTAQNVQKAKQAAPTAIVPSEAAVAARLDKMAALVYGQLLAKEARARLDG